MTQKKINEFYVEAKIKNGEVHFKNVVVEIEVTVPNENGIFKIITKIGDEEPTERIVSMNNKKIVKE